MIAWHYTIGNHFPKIASDGYLKMTPSPASITPGEIPAVWFSTNMSWENTANKGKMENGVSTTMTFAETLLHGNGLYRIGVAENRLMHWRDFKKTLARKVVQYLEWGAKERYASPNQWRVLLTPCPCTVWEDVERWDAKRFTWEPVTLEDCLYDAMVVEIQRAQNAAMGIS